MKIKICGLTNEQEAAYLNEIQADFAGMVLFYPKSKRNIDLETARRIMKALDPSIKKNAVVVSPNVEQAEEIAKCGFDYIQIHGELETTVLENVKIPVIRAFNVSNMGEMEKLKEDDRIAGFLFDAVTPGSGTVFDWTSIPDIQCPGKIVFLAGGLTPDNVKEAVLAVHPDAVDVSSGVEMDSGFGKDREKIIAFARNAREAE